MKRFWCWWAVRDLLRALPQEEWDAVEREAMVLREGRAGYFRVVRLITISVILLVAGGLIARGVWLDVVRRGDDMSLHTLILTGFVILLVILMTITVCCAEYRHLLLRALVNRMDVGVHYEPIRSGSWLDRYRMARSEAKLAKFHPRLYALAPEQRDAVVRAYPDVIDQPAENHARKRERYYLTLFGTPFITFFFVQTISMRWFGLSEGFASVIGVLCGAICLWLIMKYYKPLPAFTIIGTIEEPFLYRAMRTAGVNACLGCGRVTDGSEGDLCAECRDVTGAPA